MLMNILYEDKRYDDAIKVFYRMMDKKDAIKRSQNSSIEDKGTFFPFTAIQIAVESFLEMVNNWKNSSRILILNIFD